MLKYFNRLFFAFSCCLQILFKAEGMYIKPVYDFIDRSKRDPTTVCVQIKSNGADSYEPYLMCNDQQYSTRQIHLPPGIGNYAGENYANLYQPQAINMDDLPKSMAESNQQVNQPQTLQFGNAYEQQIQPMPNTNSETRAAFVTSRPPQFTPIQPHNTSTVPLENPSGNAATNSKETNAQPSSATSTSYVSPNVASSQGNDWNPTKSNTAGHVLSPEQFNTLLEEEVLGTPNLAFSPDEMLPLQDMYSKPLPEMPLTPQGPQVPAEYLDDPVLRAFYSIDPPQEVPYLPPTMPENKPPVLQEPISPAANINPYSSNYPIPPKMSGCMPPTEPSTFSLNSNKCFNYPYTLQPIFIAIPWISAAPNDLLTNKGIPPCGQMQYNLNKGSYRSQTNENNENTSKENLSNKTSSKIPDVPTIPSQADNNSTKVTASSEEDLFVEDATTKADKVIKNHNGALNENMQNKNDEINDNTTTSVPSTTVKTFKTMLEAAKMHAMRYQDAQNAAVTPPPNKRHIPYMTNGVYPIYRRQYVRKLDNNNM